MTKDEFAAIDGLLYEAGDHVADAARDLKRLGWDDFDARMVVKRIDELRSEIAEGYEKLEVAKEEIRTRAERITDETEPYPLSRGD